MSWRVRFLLEYDGTDYAGWQRQPGKKTIQGALENALKTVFSRSIRVVGSGRTDAGVHALGQVAHAVMPGEPEDAFKLRASLNGLTPDSIAVVALEEAPQDFDARKSARWRHYRYRVVNREVACQRAYVWQVNRPLSLAKLRRCAEALPGTSAFTSFCVARSAHKGTDCTVYRAAWSLRQGELWFQIVSNRFVHGMVRSLVGTMKEVGCGSMTVHEFERLLLEPSRRHAGPTAPPHGLCLARVGYESDDIPKKL